MRGSLKDWFYHLSAVIVIPLTWVFIGVLWFCNIMEEILKKEGKYE